MNKSFVGFLLIVIVGSLGMLGYFFAKPHIDEWLNRKTSDSRDIKATIAIGMDNWIGYFPLCGQEMQKKMRNSGYRLKCEDDNADYDGRMKSLSEGKLDMAVGTVDSFLLNGARYDFPGVIVMVIDESKGGDAIVARKNSIQNIEDLKNKVAYKVAFTPNSPSEHLLKSVAAHFEVALLRSRSSEWRMETNGSSEALEKLKKSEADIAVLWEPDVSRALSQPEFVKILGTEDTNKLIVDILLVGRPFLLAHADVARLLLSNYFSTLKMYRDQPDLLRAEVKAKVKLSDDQVQVMLKGVQFVGLYENAADWFGIGTPEDSGSEGLTESIESTLQILMDHGDFVKNPIPDADPYRLQNRSFVKELSEQGIPGLPASAFPDNQSNDPLEKKFTPLTDHQWEGLREIGTLKIRPVTFQSGTSELDLYGKSELDMAASNLKHYPHFRVVIQGNTGLNGDADANKILSKERAEAVKRYMEITYNIDSNRLRVMGLGSDKPLPRLPNESDRAYNYRLPRVELNLVSEVY